ncbi:PIR protein, putative [Plasmodium sp.]|nr:PIR protein, putative [Plasmodium sp.]
MEVHYINILLFALPLNILVYNQRSHKSTTSHTPKIATTRLLCECELYAPASYDNDSEMKKVMQQFDDRASQRFHEYGKRMKTTRQKCKEQCDIEIQKIILKDKLEKELTEKFATLQTDIQSDAIPTCICEKSVADKVEKGCLRCGSVFGGGVAPSVGILGGIGEAAISVLKPAAIEAAKKAALAEATDAAIEAGIKAVILKIEEVHNFFIEIEQFVVDLIPIVNKSNFKSGTALVETADKLFSEACIIPATRGNYSFCNTTIYSKSGDFYLGNIAKVGATTYDAKLASETTALETAKVGAVESTYAGYHISIIASIVAIVVIILVMVIIYLILRYRRKKKMKKKLQYIKLLKE